VLKIRENKRHFGVYGNQERIFGNYRDRREGDRVPPLPHSFRMSFGEDVIQKSPFQG
jgi:hypothetical protein